MQSTQVQLRRGTAAQHAVFTGAVGEVTFNTDTNQLHAHDGITVGGHPLVLASSVGNARVNVATTNPNGIILGSPGDLCTALDTGKLWSKTSGTNTLTGWV